MMFGKTIVSVVGSSALLLGCAEQAPEPSEQEIASNLTGVYTTALAHSGTALNHDEDSFGDFRMADMDRDGRPDLVYIKRRGTPNDRVEVHVLTAASNFQTFLLHAATPLGATADTTGDFTMADVDRDGRPDLVFIKRRTTGTSTIEVHVVSAASNFQTFIQHTGTALPDVEDVNGDFTMADIDRDGRPDLGFFKNANTGTGTVEVHGLSAASGFQQFNLHSGTTLTNTEAAFGDFTMADVDRDGRLDLVFIKRRKTGSGQIEVHVLSAASNFQTFIQHAATGFSQVDDQNGDFTLIDVNLDGRPDLVFIKRRDTGTGTIEFHALAG
jgi:Cu/Zn superoxide dismutase